MREAPFVWSGPPSGREPLSRFQTDRLPKRSDTRIWAPGSGKPQNSCGFRLN